MINAWNARRLYSLISDRLNDVEIEIADVKEMYTKPEFDEICQVILLVNMQNMTRILEDTVG